MGCVAFNVGIWRWESLWNLRNYILDIYRGGILPILGSCPLLLLLGSLEENTFRAEIGHAFPRQYLFKGAYLEGSGREVALDIDYLEIEGDSQKRVLITLAFRKI